MSLEQNVWVPVLWEPVVGSGERLTVGAIVKIGAKVTSHVIIRPEAIECMFGQRALAARNLIEHALDLARQVCEHDFALSTVPIEGFFVGSPRYTQPATATDAISVCALMHSAFSGVQFEEDGDAADTPQGNENANRRFLTDVKNTVLERRPDLYRGFNRTALLVHGGDPVKFGFLTGAAVLHFSVLNAFRRGPSIKDARAKLWELEGARNVAGFPVAELITAVPSQDDPTLAPKMREGVRQTIAEIEREADEREMRFYAVQSAAQAADRLIEIVR